MLNLCRHRAETIGRKGGNDAQRREAAEDCDLPVKDALYECQALAERGKRVPPGPVRAGLKKLWA